MSSPGVSALERLEAIVANPELYALADAVPEPDPTAGGRPRTYPVFMWVLFDALLSVYGSARTVEAELSHPIVWGHLCQLIRTRFPHDEAKWLPEQPMRRHHYLYGRTRYLTHPDVLAELGAIHREHAAQQAEQLGLMRDEGRASWTHPDLARMIHADGKVITPLFRARLGDTKLDKQTGELRPVRAEPDGGLHFEGTGETAWGTKWVIVAARTERVHGRIILDVDWVSQPGVEAKTAVGCFDRLRPHLPGAQGVIYDTALRGVHHQHLLRDLGWLSINRVTAAVAAVKTPRRKGGERVERSTFVEDRVITLPDGTDTTIHLFAKAGAVGIGLLDATGTVGFNELERVRTHRNADKSGAYRWYNIYRLPERLGGGTITVRLHATDDDRARRFNRTENIRQIAPSDPDFKHLYRRRNDAESINRALDDTLWLRRAHSIGHQRQHLNLITHALGVNSLAMSRHSRHHGDPPNLAQAA